MLGWRVFRQTFTFQLCDLCHVHFKYTAYLHCGCRNVPYNSFSFFFFFWFHISNMLPLFSVLVYLKCQLMSFFHDKLLVVLLCSFFPKPETWIFFAHVCRVQKENIGLLCLCCLLSNANAAHPRTQRKSTWEKNRQKLRRKANWTKTSVKIRHYKQKRNKT